MTSTTKIYLSLLEREVLLTRDLAGQTNSNTVAKVNLHAAQKNVDIARRSFQAQTEYFQLMGMDETEAA